MYGFKCLPRVCLLFSFLFSFPQQNPSVDVLAVCWPTINPHLRRFCGGSVRTSYSQAEEIVQIPPSSSTDWVLLHTDLFIVVFLDLFVHIYIANALISNDTEFVSFHSSCAHCTNVSACFIFRSFYTLPFLHRASARWSLHSLLLSFLFPFFTLSGTPPPSVHLLEGFSIASASIFFLAKPRLLL